MNLNEQVLLKAEQDQQELTSLAQPIIELETQIDELTVKLSEEPFEHYETWDDLEQANSLRNELIEEHQKMKTTYEEKIQEVSKYATIVRKDGE